MGHSDALEENRGNRITDITDGVKATLTGAFIPEKSPSHPWKTQNREGWRFRVRPFDKRSRGEDGGDRGGVGTMWRRDLNPPWNT